MASGMQAAISIRSKRKKEQEQHRLQQPPALQLQLRPPQFKFASNIAASRNTVYTSYSPDWNSPRRSNLAWDGSSDASGYDGSQLGLAHDASNEAIEHRLRADKAYKKWLRRHRVADSLSASYNPKHSKKTAAAIDMLMWIGLVILMMGMIISFVGLGEKGFRTHELRLVGPILSGFGLALCIFRIGLCCFGYGGQIKTVDVAEELSRAVRVQHVVAVQAIHYNCPVDGHAAQQRYQSTVQIDQGLNLDLDSTIDTLQKAAEQATTTTTGDKGAVLADKPSPFQTTTAIIEHANPLPPVSRVLYTKGQNTIRVEPAPSSQSKSKHTLPSELLLNPTKLKNGPARPPRHYGLSEEHNQTVRKQPPAIINSQRGHQKQSTDASLVLTQSKQSDIQLRPIWRYWK